ncbi:hypothetical protein Leryth_012283 [Lithospermum erythrorhizon]|nr:hypothetical protein Leryth_012283 [Lithospermum erythrorhizon]
MGKKSNNSQNRSKSSWPYIVLLIFAALFVFKVDVFISRAISNGGLAGIAIVERKQNHVVVKPEDNSDSSDESSTLVSSNGTFDQQFILTWGEKRGGIHDNGERLTLSLDKKSGSGFQSRKEYIYCKIHMQIKLIPGNAAGTVTTYYLSSEGIQKTEFHDEIDFEFLGNTSGNPYTLHTNIFTRGKGEREMQYFLWFDPTADFHTYSILWNPKNIIFYVDGIPIREHKNTESIGVPYPKDQPMRLFSSLWDAEAWATQGGRVKTDWKLAPFTASYRNFSVEACTWSRLTFTHSCDPNVFAKPPRSMAWIGEELSHRNRLKMKLLQRKHRTYNYCSDKWRFPKGPAPECKWL